MTNHVQLSLADLEGMTPFQIMSAVSDYMWRVGIPEDTIIDYSNQVTQCADSAEAIAFTRGFLRK